MVREFQLEFGVCWLAIEDEDSPPVPLVAVVDFPLCFVWGSRPGADPFHASEETGPACSGRWIGILKRILVIVQV